MQKFIVSRDDSIYEAFPDVAFAKDGRLVCVFTECEHHGNRNSSRLVVKISADRGRSWSEKYPVTERGTNSAFFDCARLSLLSDGRLAMVCNFVERGGGKTRYANYLWFSDDGVNWGVPVELPLGGIVPDRLVELKSGRWVFASHNYSPEHGKLAQYCIISDDRGKTWSKPIVIASDPRYNLCEASMVEVEPNVIVAFMRENSGMGYDCFKAISRDGGESWAGPFNVPLPGCHRPTAGILRDGRLLITYRFMQGGGGWLGWWTQNMFGAFLPAECLLATERHEQSARIFPIDYDRSPVSDIGYTGWVQFDDGEVYVVNYLVDDAPKAYIRASAFYPEEFTINT